MEKQNRDPDSRKIVITLGDPGGIGIEVALKALVSKEIEGIEKIVFIGDVVVLKEALRMLDYSLDIKEILKTEEGIFEKGVVNIFSLGMLKSFEKCRATSGGGRASFEYIKKAVEIVLSGEADAMVTAPISKEALKMAGINYPGHTEMLADLTDTKDIAMMLCGDQLKVILVTIHCPLKEVPDLISHERVLRTIRLANRAAFMLGMESPKIAVSGLNPHSGESGIFGIEEINEIQPAVKNAKELGINVTGPYPPDIVFHNAYKGEIDIVVSMYHDQGLIPLKMIAFERGVNITIGLPIIRTSPDHGTAYDIAWKGIADPASMIEAIKMAKRLRL